MQGKFHTFCFHIKCYDDDAEKAARKLNMVSKNCKTFTRPASTRVEDCRDLKTETMPISVCFICSTSGLFSEIHMCDVSIVLETL